MFQLERLICAGHSETNALKCPSLSRQINYWRLKLFLRLRLAEAGVSPHSDQSQRYPHPPVNPRPCSVWRRQLFECTSALSPDKTRLLRWRDKLRISHQCFAWTCQDTRGGIYIRRSSICPPSTPSRNNSNGFALLLRVAAPP